jgi:peptidoglycan/xylan/chitin deacetylase (PgdA/CDA1 family)
MYLAGQVPPGSSPSDRSGARAGTQARRAGSGSSRTPTIRSGSSRALLSAVATLAVLSLIVAMIGHRRPLDTDAARAASPPRARLRTAGGEALYRVVGCRSAGAVAHREGPRRMEVAIGFDDGPWTETAAFVTMLERNHATATFFMIGRQLGRASRPLLLRELRAGDVLGDHTYSHPDLTRLSPAGVRSQLQGAIDAIRAQSGYTPCLFRPPYGAEDASVLRIARSLGLSTVLWNVDPADYSQPGKGAIEQRVLAQVRPGSIIISHDGGGPRGQTLAAYPGILRRLRARGYRIVTMLEMLGYRPVYEPCIELCDGIGLPRGQLPRGAIIKRSP